MDDAALPNLGIQAADSVGGIVWELARCTLLGVLLGVVLAVVSFLLLRKLGWYGRRGGAGRVGRVLLCFFLIVALGILGGLGGHALGLYRGVQRGLKEGPIGQQVLPRVGEVCADFLLILDQKGAGDQAEMDVKGFVLRVNGFKETAVKTLMVELKQKILAKNPDWRGGMAEDLLEWGLQKLANSVLDKGQSKLGIPKFLEALQLEAAKKGDPHTIGRAELVVFFSDEIIIPGLLQPVRSYVRGTLVVVSVIALVVIFGPVLLIRLFGGKEQRPPPSRGA